MSPFQTSPTFYTKNEHTIKTAPFWLHSPFPLPRERVGRPRSSLGNRWLAVLTVKAHFCLNSCAGRNRAERERQAKTSIRLNLQITFLPISCCLNQQFFGRIILLVLQHSPGQGRSSILKFQLNLLVVVMGTGPFELSEINKVHPRERRHGRRQKKEHKYHSSSLGKGGALVPKLSQLSLPNPVLDQHL